MKRQVTLDYTLAEGWLAPWLDGLRNGQAVASGCSGCDTAYFPPLRVCPACCQPTDGWRTLTGRATVQFRTTGTDGDIAMVQFEGATGAAIAQADTLAIGTKRCAIAPSPQNPPTLALTAEPNP